MQSCEKESVHKTLCIPVKEKNTTLHHSIACTVSSNNLNYSFSIWLYSLLHHFGGILAHYPVQRCSSLRFADIVPKSGQCNTWPNFFFFNLSVANCCCDFGSLSCCMTQFWPSCSCRTDWGQSTPPSLCLTAGMRCLFWYAVFGFRQTSSLRSCLTKGDCYRAPAVCSDATLQR